MFKKLVMVIALTVGISTAAVADYTLIVPQEPGKGTSVWGEIIAKNLEKFVGEPVVVRHIPGARDIPGFNKFHNSLRFDDKTIMVAHGGNGVSYLLDKVDYNYFDYELIGHREGDLVKLGILVNSEPVDALAMMVHKDFAQSIGREVCEKLKDLIPRHNFMIPVQAAIGGKIIARETIKGFKKDVLTKIHGGGARDRKRKLLDKQKKGKARSKQFGKVEIPQEAFIGVLKINK